MKAGFEQDKMKDACGVFAIHAPDKDVARLAYFALFSLQHRGQESAGIAVYSDKEIVCYKNMGLVTLVFDEKILRLLKGKMAVGHVRYSTTGSSNEVNAQPILAGSNTIRHSKSCGAKYRRQVAVAHNGNLVNTATLREELQEQGVEFETSSDTEVIAEMIAMSDKPTAEEAVADSLRQARGAFSIVALCEGKIFAARDSFGIRPLCLGKLGDGNWAVASETCAFSIIGAQFEREIRPGELVIIDDSGVKSVDYTKPQREALCIFEFIYFARPDSTMLGQTLYTVRKNLGAILAAESQVEADVVISVPDSGTPAAIGFAQASGIPFVDGLIKNRYVGRTFIQPNQEMRELGVKMKLNPLSDNIRGKRVVMVDDSIVRGSTSSKIVSLLRANGATEVHVRVSSPPVKFPCFYGIDTASREELVASQLSVEQIKEMLGADSLSYISEEGMFKATSMDRHNFCSACFTEEYPIPIPQQLHLEKLMYENGKKQENRVPTCLRENNPRS
ncbi:MAG: Amidophosphoribosyltransferase precursor [bacterium ADurb.Bin236]|nr:MAG: Amidophosphoribosyltransferase precursor [bacterium ADurb.Bin236]HPN94227.1 amidophosphoribosyltransferase [bacterium]